jgi:hypothetical protein
VVGKIERQRRVLLHQKHADLGLLIDGTQRPIDFLHDQRRETERRFV